MSSELVDKFHHRFRAGFDDTNIDATTTSWAWLTDYLDCLVDEMRDAAVNGDMMRLAVVTREYRTVSEYMVDFNGMLITGYLTTHKYDPVAFLDAVKTQTQHSEMLASMIHRLVERGWDGEWITTEYIDGEG